MDSRAFVEPWAPAAFLSDYDGYCPIQQVPELDCDGEELTFLNPFATEPSSQEARMPVSRVVDQPGFLVLELGSIEEDHTRETTAGAIYSSLFSLFSACSPNVHFERIRTGLELSEVMKARGQLWSHIVIVDHGGESGLCLLDQPSSVTGEQLGGMLAGDPSRSRPVQIISLCCHSGCALVSQALSRNDNVTDVVAPDGVFDMRWAVVFVTGYFLKLFQSTDTIEQAVAAAAAWCDELPIVVWRDGEVVSDA